MDTRPFYTPDVCCVAYEGMVKTVVGAFWMRFVKAVLAMASHSHNKLVLVLLCT
jgi:hypothetical protein